MRSTDAESILITGAAGYIGGSIVSDFVHGIVPSLKDRKIVAAVRSNDQAVALSGLGVTVIRLDLADREAVTEAIVDNNVFIVIHTASSLIPELATNLITGLNRQRKRTGQQTYFIHTSAMSAFMPRTGWPSEKLRGSGHEIFETEKRLADSYPVRKTDVTVIECAQTQGVTSFIVVPCLTHGKGTGVWNKLSIGIPVVVNASIERKEVRQFADNIQVSHVHISDLTSLYGLIVEKILQDEQLPNGTEGFYFSTAYKISSHEFNEHLARALYRRGLVASSRPEVWPSTDAAAEGLGVPAKFVEYLWNSGDDAPSAGIGKAPVIGWQPKWNKEKFLGHIDDEIDAVAELGKAKSSLIDSLFAAAKE